MIGESWRSAFLNERKAMKAEKAAEDQRLAREKQILTELAQEFNNISVQDRPSDLTWKVGTDSVLRFRLGTKIIAEINASNEALRLKVDGFEEEIIMFDGREREVVAEKIAQRVARLSTQTIWNAEK